MIYKPIKLILLYLSSICYYILSLRFKQLIIFLNSFRHNEIYERNGFRTQNLSILLRLLFALFEHFHTQTPNQHFRCLCFRCWTACKFHRRAEVPDHMIFVKHKFVDLTRKYCSISLLNIIFEISAFFWIY